MSTKEVTFTVVPAEAVSRTKRAPGKKLSYLMIIGVEVDGRSAVFSHAEYGNQVKPGAKASTQTHDFPAKVADRILAFAQACFVGTTPYDGWDFTEYIIGAQATPTVSTEEHNAKPKTRTAFTRKVVPGKINLVASSNGAPLKSFFGLEDGQALTVLGSKGVFGITPVKGLMEVYGGSILGYEIRG